MTRHGFALFGLVIVAIAAWAYNVNYNTMTTLDRVSILHTKIAKEREALQVLRVEWAYLNAPERLKRLVAQNNDQLGLAPMMPEHLMHTAAVPFPENDARTEEPESLWVVAPGIPVPVARPASWSAQ